jgi:hypothetical protein
METPHLVNKGAGVCLEGKTCSQQEFLWFTHCNLGGGLHVRDKVCFQSESQKNASAFLKRFLQPVALSNLVSELAKNSTALSNMKIGTFSKISKFLEFVKLQFLNLIGWPGINIMCSASLSRFLSLPDKSILMGILCEWHCIF